MDFFVNFVVFLMKGFTSIMTPLIDLVPDLSVITDYYVVIGSVFVVLGLVFTLFGNKMQQLLLRLGFLVAGFYIGYLVCSSFIDNPSLPLAAGAIVGLLLCIFEPFLLKLFFFTVITYFAASILQPVIYEFITENGDLALLLAIGVGILVSFLAIYVILPVFLAILIAAIGAYFTGMGVAIGYGQMIFDAVGDPTFIIVTAVTGVLFLLGLILNFRVMTRSKNKKYSYEY